MLKPEQYTAIEWLSQIKHGGKTKEEIAQLCGVSRQTLHRWERDDEFQDELRKEIARGAMNRLPEVINAMVDSAITLKSAAAAKLIFQSCSMLVDEVRIEETRRKSTEPTDIEALKAKLEAFKAARKQEEDTVQ
ncbi:phBC6A51 family helix-turn-helix protein [Paenibacillus elgii]